MPARRLGLLAFVLGLLGGTSHAVEGLLWPYGRGLPGDDWLSLLHNTWPWVAPLLRAPALLLLSVAGLRTWLGRPRARRVLIAAALAVLGLVLVDKGEAAAVGIARTFGWRGTGSYMVSKLGVPGLLIWFAGAVATEAALPILILTALRGGWRSDPAPNPLHLARAATVLALVAAGANVVYHASEYRAYMTVHGRIPPASYGWLARADMTFHVAQLMVHFVAFVLMAAGAAPAVWLVSWGRRLLLAGAWLLLAVSLAYAAENSALVITNFAGLTNQRFANMDDWPKTAGWLANFVRALASAAALPAALIVVLGHRPVRRLFD